MREKKSYQGSSHAQDVVELLSVYQRDATPHGSAAEKLGTRLHGWSFSPGTWNVHDLLRPDLQWGQRHDRGRSRCCSCVANRSMWQSFTILKAYWLYDAYECKGLNLRLWPKYNRDLYFLRMVKMGIWGICSACATTVRVFITYNWLTQYLDYIYI